MSNFSSKLVKQVSLYPFKRVASDIIGTYSLRHSSSSAAKKLAERVAIVTGSTDGIGLAIAKRLLDDGAKVVVCSRKQNNVNDAVKILQPVYANQVVGTACHVAKEEDREHLIDFTLKHFGRIDILVSNVAVNPYFGNLIEMEESMWDKIFEVNVKAPFLLSKKVVPHMLKNNRPGDNGAIIYNSSIAAYCGWPGIGAYSVSKTALLGLCKNMASELGPSGIRVNVVAPGFIKTRFSEVLWNSEGTKEALTAQIHLKRFGESVELGGIVSFLSGPDASYITGENIVVAGGMHSSL